MTETGTDFRKAAALLEAGKVVAVPTETVYGLAANATDADAVLKIFEAKQRPQFNPLIVHVPETAQAFDYALAVPDAAHRLAAAFWPGPLTLLLPKKNVISDLVTAGSDRVALRVPAHPLFRTLLKQLSFPLAAPSANRSGSISPTRASHVQQSLDGRIPYILDGGESAVGLESTIVGFDAADQPVLYRVGGLSPEAIEAVLGHSISLQHQPAEHPVAPGQLRVHYAPDVPLYLGDLNFLSQQHPSGKTVIICFRNPPVDPIIPHFMLAPEGDLETAAKNLFTALHWANSQAADQILAEPVPETGLGLAINDRLRRASVNYEF
ncbi:MAG: threonylcarbamoyl-AMP synthase [Sphingobacteriales bacterium]|nr:MAG: threonylcarbamoyl-AMP synthase [Sphingobacteriales bacterium]